jgi:hypothetical protein
MTKEGQAMKKKIRVELEMSPDKFKELIETITMGRNTISEEELERLSKVGEVRAADFLDAREIVMLEGLFSSFSSQLKNGLTSNKIKSGIETGIKVGIKSGIVATVSVERQIPLEEEEDLPKE